MFAHAVGDHRIPSRFIDDVLNQETAAAADAARRGLARSFGNVVMVTCAPSETKRVAVAKPMPDAPPVMSALFPWMRPA